MQLGEFFAKCKRVWIVMRKPTAEEFKTIAKASGLGILALGFIGFVVALVVKLLG